MDSDPHRPREFVDLRPPLPRSTTPGPRRAGAEDNLAQLTAQCELLRRLFRQAPSFMAVLRGPEHEFELVNTAYLQLVGHRDIGGKAFRLALPEMAGQAFLQLLDQVLGSGEPYVGAAMPIGLQRRPGAPLETRYVDFVYQPIIEPDGSVSGVFVDGNDVTDRTVAEEALREADRRKDEFLATLAHELRSPLAPIRYASKIAKTASALSPQLSWAHDVIDRQVEHMSRLLEDLLDVSRISLGRLTLRKQPVLVADSVRAAIESARSVIAARHLRLEVDIDGGEQVFVDADPIRLEQILSNLLTNASKYTNDGGALKVTVQSSAGQVVTTVADNGIGIAPETLPFVFDMFAQAKVALHRAEGGLGIGLSQVRALVLLHGGKVEARSGGTGRGSEFVVTLPRAAGAATPAGRTAPAVQIEAQGADKMRILVADDNRDSADACSMLLEFSGHELRTAYSGTQALALAKDFLPHVALLDIGMPGHNGYEVARLLRQSEWGAQMTLIAMTGWGLEEDRQLAREAGFDHHLTKPVDTAALAALLAQAAVGLTLA